MMMKFSNLKIFESGPVKSRIKPTEESKPVEVMGGLHLDLAYARKISSQWHRT